MNLVRFFDRAIEFLFYSLFFLIPIVLSPATFELFEFNKMWLTFGITALIGFFWIGKMILQRRISIRRTPLDIPIAIFLLSQLISTAISIDSHVSLWGYYSRFNGGLLSYICYAFLFYAFVSNFNSKEIVKKMLFVSIASGVFVALWGLPSHFGYDPTCKLFKGSLDVSCWTNDFQPKVRIFSTMGQPAWLAAYLAILLPIALHFAVSSFKKASKIFDRYWLLGLLFSAISVLFFVDLLYTRTRAGVIAIFAAFAIFFGFLLFEEIKNKKQLKEIVFSKISVLIAAFIVASFFIGTGIGFLDKFNFNTVKDTIVSKPAETEPAPSPLPFRGEFGGTDSSKIRLIVWRGALDVFKNNPIFGTGVETFAYSYYKYRPPEHNLTSEWNFLYNKAHNEFLNFMANTGIFGITTYLMFLTVMPLIIFAAFFPAVKRRANFILRKINAESFPDFPENKLLSVAFLASFATISVTNFFGFSVVITNIYLFMIPAFLFITFGMLSKEFSIKLPGENSSRLSTASWIGLSALALPAIFILLFLINSWRADTWYALGYNLDRAGAYQEAYPLLQKAVAQRPGEPVFRDELAVNNAVLATGLMTSEEGDAEENSNLAQSLAQQAIETTNKLTQDYPSNIVFLKSKVRIFYTLAQIDPSYLQNALQAIRQTAQLAPTEASIQYNLGVLTGQNGDSEEAVKILERTVMLKPDYRDAYFALGLFYHDLAVDESGNTTDNDLLEKAKDQMKFILENLNENDTMASEQLSAWDN